MAAASEKQYEIVLLGATGYTGRLTAEYITTNVATDLKWAIAGRNGKKLEEIAAELKKLNPDRLQPAIEVTEQKNPELTELAKKTKVIITTVGPYAKWGEPVVKACVEGGAHYLDVTGEIPFTYDMMNKYHDAAKAKGVCIVPHCGIDSVPSDILTYLCAKTTRERLNTGITDCVNSLQKLVGNASGGTIASALGLVENYSLKFLQKSLHPTALTPIPAPKAKPSTLGLLYSLLGWRHVKDLGVLTDSPQAVSDIGIVYRSWALFNSGAYYGPKFTFTEFMRASNIIAGGFIHYASLTFFMLMYLRPFRWFLRKFAYVQGEGPTREDANKGSISYKAIAKADEPKQRRSFASMHYQGGFYYLTGIMLAEAGLTLARGGDTLGRRLGGMITPATLEMEYVERLQKGGIEIEWGLLDQ